MDMSCKYRIHAFILTEEHQVVKPNKIILVELSFDAREITNDWLDLGMIICKGLRFKTIKVTKIGAVAPEPTFGFD
ncbi:MAG TPA: hypothetical protein PKE04_08190 [Clostridia bacterium]|nr:hypothetical protein [Clostridia bacterium]